MKKVFALVAVVGAILVVGAACGVAQEDYEAVVAERNSAQAESQSVKSELDAMKSVTLPKEAIKLSELIPTMGEHWANPATLPVGPIYLVHDEEVIGAEYMFTSDLMEEVTLTTPEGEETFKHLPGLPVDVYVDHMEIEFFSQGHEGFEVPHFDVHLYFISPEERQEELVPHAH